MSLLKVLHGGARPTMRKDSMLLVRAGKVRRIRDLKWLLRRGKQVAYFEIGSPIGIAALYRSNPRAAVMRAYMHDGSLFYTVWRCKSALACWLDRPMFDGKRVLWFGQERRAGTALCIEEGDS